MWHDAVRTKITVGPRDVTLVPGQHVIQFGCEVSSDPSTAVDVVWLRGDRPVAVDGQRVYVSATDRSLVLNVTNEEDSGRSFIATYTCRASNGLTTDHRHARLRPPQATGHGNDTLLNNSTQPVLIEYSMSLFGLKLGMNIHCFTFDRYDWFSLTWLE